MGKITDSFPDTKLGNLLSNARWAFSLTWSTDRRLFLGIIFVILIQSVLPASLALTLRKLINTATEILEGQVNKGCQSLKFARNGCTMQ